MNCPPRRLGLMPAFFRTLTIVGAQKYAPNGEAGRKAGVGGMLWNEAGGGSRTDIGETYHHFFTSANRMTA